MALTIRSEEEVDIDGFAGIRERRLVMDQRMFGRRAEEGTWQGLADCCYFANAWFLKKRGTGLHAHQNVDIVSVITRGQIYHGGTMGEGETVVEDQVQVQMSRGTGFKHNEENPLDDVSAMLQIWMMPTETEGEGGYHIVDTQAGAYTEAYKSASTKVGILRMNAGDRFQLQEETLGYVYRGAVQVAQGQAGHVQTLERGMIFRLSNENLDLLAEQDVALALIQHA